VCGCPLVVNVFDPSGEFCRVAKRRCNRHHAWEKLHRAEVDMERLRQVEEQQFYIRFSPAAHCSFHQHCVFGCVGVPNHATLKVHGAIQSQRPPGRSILSCISCLLQPHDNGVMEHGCPVDFL